MGTKTASGFTIIEVMLFLAVTGALAAGILVGSGVAIGQQRYRDSVNSLKSLIQSQYNETANVVNGRSGSESCDNNAVLASPNPVVTPQPRGTTDCLLMGRLLTISNGTDITIANVVGYRTADTSVAPLGTSDVAELKNYNLNTSPIDQETNTIEWSARAVTPHSTAAEPLSLLIVHSPLSGSVLTFTSTSSPPPTLNQLVIDSAGTNRSQTVNLCIEGSAGTFVGNKLAVRINPYASSPSAIEIPTEYEGGAPVC